MCGISARPRNESLRSAVTIGKTSVSPPMNGSGSRVQHPEQTLDRRFDLIIAEQVLEHVQWPYRAVKNIRAMLNPGGAPRDDPVSRQDPRGTNRLLPLDRDGDQVSARGVRLRPETHQDGLLGE